MMSEGDDPTTRGPDMATTAEVIAESVMTVPAAGQLVTARNRRWVVAAVQRGSVTSSDVDSFSGRAPHLVSLVSIEDDAPEEELRVVWELETGAVVHENTVLPSPEHGFDTPSELDAFLHAVRWGAVASADKAVLAAPFRSGVQLEDYQLDPVVRALSMPRTNLLIADDVGLGKTIEAGLVVQELMLRHRARTALIVCPAGLTIQWRDEMRDKFGLDFRIVNRDLLKQLRRSRGLYTNPWAHYPRLIVSIDWLKRERPMRLLREFLPTAPGYPRAIDLLLVDEVHTCAPSGNGRYAVDSLRTKAIRTLAPHCEHRLFLSATPHNGYLESFTALLELLDDQRFARTVRPTETQLRRVMVRRLKNELPPKWDGTPRFGQRDLGYCEVRYSAEEREAHELLRWYAESRRNSAVDKAAVTAADFVTTLLKRRLFSSPKAFAETIGRHLTTMTSTAVGSQLTRGEKVLAPLVNRLEETADEDTEYEGAEEQALSTASRCGPALSTEELATLHKLRDWAQWAADRPDGKFAALRDWLDPIVRPGGQWSDERVIVFTEYRDTQRWLFERLLHADYPKQRLALLYGGQDEKERERIKNVFTSDPGESPVRVLLATDAASEGINLQDHCHRVLHWEIPWNPNRLEQRNGRVDRHGQRAPVVEIRHFVPAGWQQQSFDAGTLDDELAFLRMAAEKVEKIRADLGSAGDVIAAQVEQKMLGRNTDWHAAEVEMANRASRARLKVDRDLARDLERLTTALVESRTELDLTPEAVERVVRAALNLAHRKDLLPADTPDGFPSEVFRLPELPGAWASARNTGLYHPLTGAERPVTFDQDAAAGRKDVVLLHLGHRLVQMCLRLLREELWSQARGVGGAAKLSRVTARVLPGDRVRQPVVVAHGRVVITGAEGTRLHEEIVTAGGLIEAGKFIRRKEDDLDTWLAAASEEPAAESIQRSLTELWPVLAGPLASAFETRAKQCARRLKSLLGKRCDEEITAIGELMDELERSIRNALSEYGEAYQPSLFTMDERDQLQADRDALDARLDLLPAQREREISALRARYADPKEHWFPATVTFLIPASIARAEGMR
jgi:superfamily II DNA or RNA helicase